MNGLLLLTCLDKSFDRKELELISSIIWNQVKNISKSWIQFVSSAVLYKGYKF